jgi:hypothetical protein
MPFIALAVLGASYYTAQQQRSAANQAREEAGRQNAIAAQQMDAQIKAQQAQADVARQRLATDIAKNAEEKARLESEAKSAADTLDAERRRLGEQEAARMQSLRRGGGRSLLSTSRLNPELGLGGDMSMLGAGTAY